MNEQIKLRSLELKDAPLMYEWMTDDSINKWFRFNPKEQTLKGCEGFIEAAKTDGNSLHYAIVDERDIYLGTVSLKNIDKEAQNAEYAIALRKIAQGLGIGYNVTSQILDQAFNSLNMKRVYLNVLSDNINAIRFYEKFGFVYEGEFKNHINHRGILKSLMWFRMLQDEYMISG